MSPLQDFITFGIDETPDVCCRIIRTTDATRAIAIAEELGNTPNTTIAYTSEALVELAGERPDYVDHADDYDGPPDGDAWSGGFADNH